MKPTDTRNLTVDQQAKLAHALVIIRSTQSLRGWTQYRYPPDGTPHTLRLIKRVHGNIAQVVELCRGVPQQSK